MANYEATFNEQLVIWERLKTSTNVHEVAAFLEKYPTGYFSELAEERLDILLARSGEKKLQVVSQKDNPFTKGAVPGFGTYTIGDSYSFEVIDIFSGVTHDKYEDRVTGTTEESVIFNQGERILDRLGNELKSPHPRILSPVQLHPIQYSMNHRWQSRFKWLNTSGYRVEVEIEFKVIKREIKTKPFGIFNAFYIESWGRIDQAGSITMNYWIDPELCNRPLEYEIQSKSRIGIISENSRTLLTAYQQKKTKTA